MFAGQHGLMRRAGLVTCGALLIAAGVIWLQINKQVAEGPTLLTLASDRGVTVADLLSVAAFAGAGWLFWKSRRTTPRRQ